MSMSMIDIARSTGTEIASGSGAVIGAGTMTGLGIQITVTGTVTGNAIVHMGTTGTYPLRRLSLYRAARKLRVCTALKLRVMWPSSGQIDIYQGPS